MKVAVGDGLTPPNVTQSNYQMNQEYQSRKIRYLVGIWCNYSGEGRWDERETNCLEVC